jgi:hypothetical protein
MTGLPTHIRPIVGDESRFRHVSKHLYLPRERWDLICDELGEPANAAARAAGCPGQELRSPYPRIRVVCDACREAVLRDHDERYGPAYMAAVESARTTSTYGTPVGGPRSKHHLVGSSGVYVIVHGRRGASVATAYRIVPRGARRATNEDFFKAAVRKLRDKTSWMGER